MLAILTIAAVGTLIPALILWIADQPRQRTT
jgi:hypothetical protein